MTVYETVFDIYGNLFSSQDEMRRCLNSFAYVSSNNVSSFMLLSQDCTIRRKYTVICCTLNLFMTTVFSTIVT